MRKIVLISCASKKLGRRAKAKDLYVSPLFKLNYRYALSLNPDKIFILSAKYGLVDCEREIDTYDLTLNTMPMSEVKRWAQATVKQLKRVCDLEEDYFVFLAGEKYRRFLVPYVKEEHREIPLAGLKIGKQLSWLKGRVV